MLSTLSLHVTVTDSRLASNAVVNSLFDGVSTHRTIYPLLDARSDPMKYLPSRIREGMVLLSGDVLLLFNPLQIDYNNVGAAAISFKENVETGKNHGVYLNGPDGKVKCCLQKKSVEVLQKAGAVNESGCVN